MQTKFETKAIVLDYLPNGHYGDNTPSYKRVPLAQILGVNFFSILEVVPREEVAPHDVVFIGKGERQKISHVKRRIGYDELTSFARTELEVILKDIAEQEEERFVRFFNEAGPISIRSHRSELLPGVGKKLMKEILAEREKTPFASYKDIQERISSIPDPATMIAKRILEEIMETDENKKRYFIFVKPMR